jgi:flagella basal body P-ring formation protein FlgA
MRKRQGMLPVMKKLVLLLAVLILGTAGAGGSAAAAVIKADAVKEAVKAYVEKNMPWPPGNARVSFLSRLQDVKVPGSGVTFDVRGKRNEKFIGPSDVTVNFYEGDVWLGQQTVRVRTEVLLDVALSTRALEKDSEIRKDDVKFESRWLTEIPVNAVTDLRDVLGKRITLNLRPNSEITKTMLKMFPLVRRGKMVRIILESGPLTVLTSGQSQEDGARDDLVRVKNLSSSKIIYARVVDDNTVKVEF